MKSQQMKNSRDGRPAPRWFPLLLVIALILTSCASPGGKDAVTAAADPATPTPTSVPVKASDGPVAPDWALETLDGGQFRLADHKGDVVVMFFMASWCGSCVPEAQALAELHQQYRDRGLTVVAINVEPDKKVSELSRFRQLADNAAYAWTFDTAFAVTQQYGVQALDTTILIDRTGRIAYTDTYPTPLDVLDAEIQKWL